MVITDDFFLTKMDYNFSLLLYWVNFWRYSYELWFCDSDFGENQDSIVLLDKRNIKILQRSVDFHFLGEII